MCRALLVIDVQRAIFEGKDPVYRAEELLVKINALIAKFRAASLPIIFIRHESSGLYKQNTDGWQFHPGLDYRDEDMVIPKRKGNSFLGTDLDVRLKEMGVQELVVCGLLSQLCVQRTLLGALELGYKAILVSDAHSNSATDPVAQITKAQRTLVKAGVTLLALDELS